MDIYVYILCIYIVYTYITYTIRVDLINRPIIQHGKRAYDLSYTLNTATLNECQRPCLISCLLSGVEILNEWQILDRNCWVVTT